MSDKTRDYTIKFHIPGQPKTKENKGAFGRGSYYSKTHKEIKAWEKNVGEIAKTAMEESKWKGPWKGRIGIMADMTFADYGRKDITNYWKSLNDALNGVVYLDDSQIDFAVACRKKDKHNPGIDVKIYFFDYMYHSTSAKRPDPWHQFTIENVEFDHGLEIVTKQLRTNSDKVGKYKEEEAEESGSDVKPAYINGNKRKKKNGRTTRKRPANSRASK